MLFPFRKIPTFPALTASLWCGSGLWFLFDADLELFFMRKRIRLFTLMRIRIPHCSFQQNAQTHEKRLKYAHIPYILGWHLQIDPDSDPDPAYDFDADADPDSSYQNDADPCGSGSTTQNYDRSHENPDLDMPVSVSRPMLTFLTWRVVDSCRLSHTESSTVSGSRLLSSSAAANKHSHLQVASSNCQFRSL